jgi:hypothetical protein
MGVRKERADEMKKAETRVFQNQKRSYASESKKAEVCADES